LPNGNTVKHDFTGDAVQASLFFPLFISSISIVLYLSMLNIELGFFSGLILALFTIHPESRLRIFWSISLWIGICLGVSDLILKRRGH